MSRRSAGPRREGERMREEVGEHAPWEALCCPVRAVDAHAARRAASQRVGGLLAGKEPGVRSTLHIT